MAHLAGFVDGELDDALGAGSQAGAGRRDLFAGADNVLHGRTHLGKAYSHIYQDARCYALFLFDQPQQDMLGADVVVVEALSFFLGQA